MSEVEMKPRKKSHFGERKKLKLLRSSKFLRIISLQNFESLNFTL